MAQLTAGPRFGTARQLAGRLPSAVTGARRIPVSLTLAVLTLVVSVSATLPGRYAALARAGEYRGLDLAHRQVLWRLPLSAMLSQSWLQCAWALLMIAIVFTAAERRVGSVCLLVVVSLSHIASTVVADAAAGLLRPVLLERYDYGPSCLMMGALAVLLLVVRNRWLIAGTIFMFVVDVFINSPMTIAEHVIALTVGLAACSAYAQLPSIRSALGSERVLVERRPVTNDT